MWDSTELPYKKYFRVIPCVSVAIKYKKPALSSVSVVISLKDDWPGSALHLSAHTF
jgi:hypothetical protein